MSLRGRLFTLFPLVHGGLIMVSLMIGIHGLATEDEGQALGGASAAVFFLYGFPPLCYRLHGLVSPVAEGRQRLDTPGYSPWWASLQMQGIYNALPSLEALLRLVPGVYSAWLRLWGSRIGRGVVWTPRIEISDRAFVEIGDGAVLGHRAALYAHVVDRRRDGTLVLFLKRVEVGEGAFIGAGSRLGPGSVVAPGVRVPILTDVPLGARIDHDLERRHSGKQ